ncbi:hypothetical protein AVEN_253517-1 [Araneus ventricosus]|uniref:Uncharacterized protein n=1 Tax=Araneus ventricosus TaxID=182803 RepID=A0A4Y2BUN9_ARAVE|nr:hypothetical protein AVEN_253517-1 [Araneus ventricosus]
MYEKTPCDVTACRGEYIRAGLGSRRGVLVHWNDFGVSSALRGRKPCLRRCTSSEVENRCPLSKFVILGKIQMGGDMVKKLIMEVPDWDALIDKLTPEETCEPGPVLL